MNYGERLGYWYLRLNGFFLLENFVLHRHRQGEEAFGTSDADLLALKVGGASEIIDGKVVQTDKWFSINKMDLAHQNVALIVQVKTNADGPAKAFDSKRTAQCLQRFGLYEEQLAFRLQDGAMAHSDNLQWTVAKVHLSSSKIRVSKARRDEKPPEFLSLSLEAAFRFIQRRIEHFSDRKSADRLFFSDPFMQLLASGLLAQQSPLCQPMTEFLREDMGECLEAE